MCPTRSHPILRQTVKLNVEIGAPWRRNCWKAACRKKHGPRICRARSRVPLNSADRAVSRVSDWLSAARAASSCFDFHWSTRSRSLELDSSRTVAVTPRIIAESDSELGSFYWYRWIAVFRTFLEDLRMQKCTECTLIDRSMQISMDEFCQVVWEDILSIECYIWVGSFSRYDSEVE